MPVSLCHGLNRLIPPGGINSPTLLKTPIYVACPAVGVGWTRFPVHCAVRMVINGYVRGACCRDLVLFSDPSHAELLDCEMRTASPIITGCPALPPPTRWWRRPAWSGVGGGGGRSSIPTCCRRATPPHHRWGHRTWETVLGARLVNPRSPATGGGRSPAGGGTIAATSNPATDTRRQRLRPAGCGPAPSSLHRGEEDA